MTIFYRKYSNYEDYINHQSSKIEKALKKKTKSSQKVRPECFDKRVRFFISHLKPFCFYMIENDRILCLGARHGAEVKAFVRLGFKDSIGIDLNPVLKNKYVIKGDFHYMLFEDNSFSNVFTNSLDHIFDIRKLSQEIHRILKDKGRLVLEISHFLDFEEKNRIKTVEDDDCYETFCCSDFVDITNGFKEFKLLKYEETKAKKLMVIFENVKINDIINT